MKEVLIFLIVLAAIGEALFYWFFGTFAWPF